MIKAMIISVGGTPAPIIKSIGEYGPEFISFLASQDTCDKVLEIKNGIRNIFHSGIDSKITLADDVNDLYHCFEKAEEAVGRVISGGYTKDEVIVDYTGGTKNMSVALALAAVTYGFLFSYVGGEERTKEGVGIVVNGQEKIYKSINPWDFLAIEERKKIALLFNSGQFKAVKTLIDGLSARSTKYKSLFRKLGFIVDGFYNWDMFKHKEAMERFKRGRALEELIEVDDRGIKSFAVDVKKLLEFLWRLIEMSDNGKRACNELLLDLFANAERRFEEGKTDDAILRLYRLVEMAAQHILIERYAIDTSDVGPEQIPAPLRDEYIKTYKKDGKIKIPQNAAYRLLESLGDEAGIRFRKNENRFLDIQSSRNNSYLAHGFISSKESTYTKLKEFIIELNLFNLHEVVKFPEMDF